MREYFQNHPTKVTYNGKTYYLRNPTHWEIESMNKLKREYAERMKDEREAAENAITIKRQGK